MAEEMNNITTVLHLLQNKVDRLEIVNKELEEKLRKQNANTERLLTNFNLEKSNTIIPAENQEQEELLLEEEDKNKLTVEKSIPNLPLVNIMGKFYIREIKFLKYFTFDMFFK